MWSQRSSKWAFLSQQQACYFCFPAMLACLPPPGQKILYTTHPSKYGAAPVHPRNSKARTLLSAPELKQLGSSPARLTYYRCFASTKWHAPKGPRMGKHYGATRLYSANTFQTVGCCLQTAFSCSHRLSPIYSTKTTCPGTCYWSSSELPWLSSFSWIRMPFALWAWAVVINAMESSENFIPGTTSLEANPELRAQENKHNYPPIAYKLSNWTSCACVRCHHVLEAKSIHEQHPQLLSQSQALALDVPSPCAATRLQPPEPHEHAGQGPWSHQVLPAIEQCGSPPPRHPHARLPHNGLSSQCHHIIKTKKQSLIAKMFHPSGTHQYQFPSSPYHWKFEKLSFSNPAQTHANQHPAESERPYTHAAFQYAVLISHFPWQLRVTTP